MLTVKGEKKTTIRERPESNRNSQVVEDLRHFPHGTHVHVTTRPPAVGSLVLRFVFPFTRTFQS
jgi:hypothetical protein